MSPRGRAPRKRVRNGEYKRCRRGFLGMTACPGYYISQNGVEIRHGRCGGDGWIKVGTKGGGRRPGRGSGGRRRRAAGSIAGAGVVWFGLGEWLGTVGYVLAAVLIVLAVAIRILGVTVRAVGGAR